MCIGRQLLGHSNELLFLNLLSPFSSTNKQPLKDLSKKISLTYKNPFSQKNKKKQFYNDLTEILLKFQTKVTDFVFARKTEKEDLMKDIQTNLSRPSPTSAAPPSRPPPPVPDNNSATASNTAAAPTYPYPTMPTMPSNYYGSYYPQQPQQQAPNPYYPQAYYPPAPGPGGYPQQPQVPPRK